MGAILENPRTYSLLKSSRENFSSLNFKVLGQSACIFIMWVSYPRRFSELFRSYFKGLLRFSVNMCGSRSSRIHNIAHMTPFELTHPFLIFSVYVSDEMEKSQFQLCVFLLILSFLGLSFILPFAYFSFNYAWHLWVKHCQDCIRCTTYSCYLYEWMRPHIIWSWNQSRLIVLLRQERWQSPTVSQQITDLIASPPL